MKLSIILPTRNEEVLIKQALNDITSLINKRKVTDYEVLVVINGTQDKTAEIVKGISDGNKKVKILYSKPGYGKAIKTGLKKSQGQYIAIFNIDFYDLRMIDLIEIDLYGKDFIIGSKMAYWSEDKRSILRKIVSKLFNLYLRMFFGFRGSDTHGIKLLRKEVVDRILPMCKTDSGIFDTEFVLRSQYAGYKFADFPVVVEEKRPPRFKQRVLQTPRDLVDLSRALEDLS